ncbi:TetR/AcrR family transcriptional regulator [Parasphingorhabdus sp.]|uniref:TetR/AcrR family transcriptional regulator n=1 Tax=Parasphingorhabdus sp. TaxID=2709688 RepID=UPI003266F311
MANKMVGRPRKFDDADVLHRAAQAFLQDGFEAASYEHIAAAMGLSKPSLYNAFGNKTALFERVVSEYADQAHKFIVASFSNAKSLDQAVEDLFQGAAQFYSRPEDPSIGCLLIGTALPATSQYANIRDTLTSFTLSLETSLEEVVSSRYERDAKKIGKSPTEIATHISSLIFALAVRARMGLSREQLSDIAKKLAALIH